MEIPATGTEITRKRMKPDMEEKEGDAAGSEIVEVEEFQTHIAGSEEMELNVSQILEKIERFTQLVLMFNTTLCS